MQGEASSSNLLQHTGRLPTAPRSNAQAAGHGAVAGDNNLQTAGLLELLKTMKKDRVDEADGETGLDGLRVSKTLGRMRGLKEQFKSQPRKVVKDYVKYWEEQLEAEGKPWTWKDAEQQMSFGKYRSM